MAESLASGTVLAFGRPSSHSRSVGGSVAHRGRCTLTDRWPNTQTITIVNSLWRNLASPKIKWMLCSDSVSTWCLTMFHRGTRTVCDARLTQRHTKPYAPFAPKVNGAEIQQTFGRGLV